MAGGFAEKERVEIRQRLLDSGYELSAEIGIKKMTIAMIRDTEVKYEKEMASHFSKDGTIVLKKFWAYSARTSNPKIIFFYE